MATDPCRDCRDKPASEKGSGPCLGCGKPTRDFDYRVYYGTTGPFCCVACRNRWVDRGIAEERAQPKRQLVDKDRTNLKGQRETFCGCCGGETPYVCGSCCQTSLCTACARHDGCPRCDLDEDGNAPECSQ